MGATVEVMSWITIFCGLATLALGAVVLECLCWKLALDLLNRLCAKTFKTYGGWRELENFKKWKRANKT